MHIKNQKKKTPKIPIIYRIIRFTFGALNTIAPFLAKRWAVNLFFKPISYPMTIPEIEIEKSGNGFSINSSGKLIKGLTWGEGPVILFVHGWSGRGTQFWKFVEPLVKNGNKVITFDAPAHGKSEGSKTNIIEFNLLLQEISKKFGEIKGIISHSFGGVASLYALTQGLPVNKLTMIGSPTIAEDIVTEFLRRINGSENIRPYFYEYIQKKFGVNFNDFGGKEMIKQLPELKVLLIHDENDVEVSMEHPRAFLKVKPDTQTLFTKGLGHTRILKDKNVIERCIDFIKSEENSLKENELV